MISGYINSVPFSVYSCGEIMILDDHYIKWLPSHLYTGTFTIEGSTYNFSDYSSGMFIWSTATITSFAFRSNTNFSSIETDALYISWGAFFSCRWLQNANLLYCSEIGSHAFMGCPYLSNVNASNCSYVSYYAFAECNNLREVSLTKCTYLGDHAFAYCSNLSEISLPNVKHIDFYVFSGCGLNELSLPKCEFIGNRAFYNNSTFNTITLGGSSVCVLENSRAFENTGITSITGSIYVPMSLYSSYVVASEWSYFYNRINPSNISDRYISWTPSTLTGTFRIDGSTYNFSDYSGYFVGFDWITSRAFESTGVQHIETNTPRVDYRAFYSCSSLTSVNMPDCSYIDNEAFEDCNLYKLSIPKCEYIGSWAFSNNSHLGEYDELNLPVCSYIGIGAFDRCHKLESINLPECKYIDREAFNFCHRLESISLPECGYIGKFAFAYCFSLRKINLPKCKYIANGAFCGTNGGLSPSPLYSITLSGYTMCSLQTSEALIWTSITSSTGYIFVNAARVTDYKLAPGWNYFINRIFPVSGSSYYMSWTPASLSGTIRYFSVTYNLSDYSSGYFSMPDWSIFATSELGSLFYGNSEIETLEMSVKELSGPLFANCTSLSYVKLIDCSRLYESVFMGCTNLQEIDLPSCRKIDSYVFSGCTSLSAVSLPVCSYINTYAFYKCGIVELTLPWSSGVCYLGDGVFESCPLSAIYVPSNLVYSYKNNSMWSSLSSIIYPIPV